MKTIQKYTTLAIAASLLALPSSAQASYPVGEGDLTVRAGVTEVYDDNIIFVPINEIDDLISKLSVGGDLVYEGKTQNLTLSGDIITVSEGVF